MLYLHLYATLVYVGSLDMCFYTVIPFTMYLVIVHILRIGTFCMSEAIMQLVAGTLCYENVVIHIM